MAHAVDEIDDIEDVYVDVGDSRAQRAPLAATQADRSAAHAPVDAQTKASVPGVQAVFVKTFGCSHNQSDSEYMMGALQAYGYRCMPPLG